MGEEKEWRGVNAGLKQEEKKVRKARCEGRKEYRTRGRGRVMKRNIREKRKRKGREETEEREEEI